MNSSTPRSSLQPLYAADDGVAPLIFGRSATLTRFPNKATIPEVAAVAAIVSPLNSPIATSPVVGAVTAGTPLILALNAESQGGTAANFAYVSALRVDLSITRQNATAPVTMSVAGTDAGGNPVSTGRFAITPDNNVANSTVIVLLYDNRDTVRAVTYRNPTLTVVDAPADTRASVQALIPSMGEWDELLYLLGA